MGRCDDLGNGLFAPLKRRRHVSLQDRGKGFRGLPFRMLRCQSPDPVESKGELDIDRLLDPQRAIVVEHGQPVGRGHEPVPALLRDALHKADDRLCRRTGGP